MKLEHNGIGYYKFKFIRDIIKVLSLITPVYKRNIAYVSFPKNVRKIKNNTMKN